MKIALCGFTGPVALAARAELISRGHDVQTSPAGAECVIFSPGKSEELETLVNQPGLRRLVVRSHAYAYGANPKNPGLMDESRISLLPPTDPAQRWLKAEEIVARHPNYASVRLSNVLAPEEGDSIVTKLTKGITRTITGRNPNVQFISVADAARALVAAAESNATGIFNASGSGAIPLVKAFRAARTRQVGVPSARNLESLEYNWTVSGDRAARELGFIPEQSTVEALKEFLLKKPGAQPGELLSAYDDWGLDIPYIRNWGTWFAFLTKVYWRIETEGMDHIPSEGKGLFIANHRGFMPLDAVMHLSLLFTLRNRVPRFLIAHTLLRTPGMMNFLTKLGGVVASQENAKKLFDQGALVGMFPEGIRGTFSPYKTTYRLRNFSKGGFARMAVENQSPIYPAAVVGHAEIFPIIGRIDSSFVVKELGWPYLPIAPLFPLAPIPLPSKWHVRMLKPVSLQGLTVADAENNRLMKSFSEYVQSIVQANIDDMLPRRTSIFWGNKVLNGQEPAVPPFQPKARQASAHE